VDLKREEGTYLKQAQEIPQIFIHRLRQNNETAAAVKNEKASRSEKHLPKTST
jgi:hypothetical protein